jgi:predicted dehydrogenase
MNRREFLGLGAMVGANAVLGCSSMSKKNGGNVCSGGAPMINFAAPAMKRIRVGVVGLGARGAWAVNRLSMIPGVDVRAVCDVEQDRVDAKVKWAEANGKPTIKGFGGREDSWRSLCEYDGIDVVYNTTPWQLHAKVSVYAMECGKHTFIEVPAAMTLDEIWQLINTSERTRKHCMQLENCVYDFFELTTLNMAQKGVFGEILHVEGSYIHNLSDFWDSYWNNWRLDLNQNNRGDVYPTHGFGPACQLLDIHRGDRLKTLVAMDTKAVTGPACVERQTGKKCEYFENGDHTLTMLTTENGKTMLIEHNVMTPRPYSRMYQLTGTDGFANKYPVEQYCLRPGDNAPKNVNHENLSIQDIHVPQAGSCMKSPHVPDPSAVQGIGPGPFYFLHPSGRINDGK